MKFVVLKHTQPANQVPFPRRRFLQKMSGEAEKFPANGGNDAVDGATHNSDQDNVPPGIDVHYDLMLETDEGLLTWAMGHPPKPKVSCGAIKLPLHREIYLTHQGPVSQDRGSVDRIMEGNYQFETATRILLHSSNRTIAVAMDEIQPEHFRFSFFSVDPVVGPEIDLDEI